MGRKRKFKCSTSKSKRKKTGTLSRFGWVKLPGLPFWPVVRISKDRNNNDKIEVYAKSDDAFLQVNSTDSEFLDYTQFKHIKKREGKETLQKKNRVKLLDAFESDIEWIEKMIKEKGEQYEPVEIYESEDQNHTQGGEDGIDGQDKKVGEQKSNADDSVENPGEQYEPGEVYESEDENHTQVGEDGIDGQDKKVDEQKSNADDPVENPGEQYEPGEIYESEDENHTQGGEDGIDGQDKKVDEQKSNADDPIENPEPIFFARPVAVIDPSSHTPEFEVETDIDESDEESVDYSSGSSYKPSEDEGSSSDKDTTDEQASLATETRAITSDPAESLEWRRSSFKNVHIESYQLKDGKRNYSKTVYCCFCMNSYSSKLSKHLFAVHPTKSKVKEIMAMELNSQERKNRLLLIQNEGNFIHNTQVIQKGEGTIIVNRRPTGEVGAHEYLPCQHCKGFFHEKLLWSHFSNCPAKPELTNHTRGNSVREAKCMLAPFMQKQDEQMTNLDDIIDKMKETKDNPGLKNICHEDELIREFGLYQLARLGPPNEQRPKDQINVRTKMRTLARLLTKLNDNCVFSQPLNHYICPANFTKVVNAVKELYQEACSSQLAIALGHYIKQVSLLKASLGLQQEDSRKKKEANDFTELFIAQWNGKVSAVANRSKRLKALNKRTEMPSTEDLTMYKDFLVSETKSHVGNFKPTYAEYVYFTHLLISRIVLFNKRRVTEVSELTVIDFRNRIKGEEMDANTEIYDSLETSEKILMKRMELIEVRGKSTRGLRKVFVLLTPDMVEGLDHLLTVLLQTGIPLTNKYLFSRLTDTPQDGCEAIRVTTAACTGLLYPERIRSTKLRKYLATTTQIMDMSSSELKLIADHMGHSVAIHTEVYRLQSSVLERTKVAHALVALEEGQLSRFQGRQLSTISLDELPEPGFDESLDSDLEQVTDVNEQQTYEEHADDLSDNPTVCGHKQRRWSQEEENDIQNAFQNQIKQRKNCSATEIREAKKKYQTLAGRSEAVIRTKINNIILGKYK